jgi:uncharacterized repeat protein (TIGR01451 family)/gliding motility-associated-like protein
VSGPSNGTVTVDPVTGVVTYTPNPNFNGTDSFVYSVCDTGMPILCDTAVVTINVTSVNDAPVAVDDNATTVENTPINIDILNNDSDPDGNLDPTSVSIISGPSNGTVSINPVTGATTYTPNPSFTGTDSFVYSVCDTGVPIYCDSAVVTITIPAGEVDLSVNKTASPLIMDVLTPVTFTITAANLGPDPASGVTVTDILSNSFTYVSSSASVGSYDNTTGIWTIGNLGVLGIETLTITAIVNPQGNHINTSIISGDQSDPDTTNNSSSVTVFPKQFANLTVVKTVNDLTPNIGEQITFTITVTNNGPSTANNVVSTDTLNNGFTYISSSATQGSYDFATHQWTIGSLANGQTVTLNINVTVNPIGPWTNIATVIADEEDTIPDTDSNIVNVTPPPFAIIDYATAVSGNPTLINILGNDVPTYNPIDPTSVTIVMNPSNGSVTIDPVTGSLTYTPDVNFVGLDSLIYNVCDTASPPLCDTAIVYINVSAPVAVTGVIQNVSCFGGSDGSIEIIILAGTPPFSYLWSTGDTTQIITGIPAGTYSAIITDANGTTTSNTWSVTEPDSIVITGITTVTLCNTNDGSVNITVTGGTQPYTFNWSNGQITEDLSGLSAGTYTLNLTDSNGCTASQVFIINAIDTIAPVIANCPTNLSIPTNSLSCDAVANWTLPTATDNCTLQSFTSTHNPGDVFPIGVTTVTYTAVDSVGNTSTCSFTVTVTDTQVPVISGCPADINTTNDATTCGAVVNWTAPTATDNCSAGLTFTSSHNPGDVFPVGTTVVTYTATDASGNVTTCTFNVTVADTEAPIAAGCPADINVTNDFNICSAVVNWTAPTFSDNCTGGLTVISSHNPGTVFPVGTTVVTYTATDAAGNVATCTFNVVVTDSQLPVISSCPTNINVNTTLGQCSAVANWTLPAMFDNCPGATLSSTHNPGDVFPIGTTTVTYTATDAGGNTATCTFTVTVTDTELPVISGCPANINVTATGASCDAVANWTSPTATDNCTLQSFTSTHNPGDVFPIGVTTVTYTAVDSVGNTSTCSFTVTVTDTQVPVISGCPADINTTNDATTCGAVVNWTAPTATDNCSAGLTFTSSHNPGDVFPVGTTVVTYTATDASGNVTTCTFNVTVADTEAPVITNCPSDIVSDNFFNTCYQQIYWPTPVVVDNCSSSSVTVTMSHQPGFVFPVGTTPVTITAIDNNGNSTTCSFNVTIVDTQVPTIEGCPVDVTVNTQAGACGAIVTWIQPTAFDNCPGVVVTSTHNSGDFFPLGTTTVVFTATDAVGLSVTCSYNITVVDTEAPVISNCPSAITQNVTGLACDAVVNWTPPTAADNCILQSLTSSHNPGDVFPVGVTTVIYTAVDAAGNTSTCSFPVTITDTQLPIISGCPANIIVSNDPGVCGAVVSWIPPTASDNCAGGLTFTSTHNPGALFPIGITTVTYTATDAGGNTVTCSFTVTVNDTQAPITLNCPTNINVNNTFNTCGAIVNWVPPTFTDNCSGPVTVVASHFPGATFPVGITVVTYTATDANGNVTVCSFNINVTDTQAPLIVGCPANINTTAQPGVCGASVVWTIPTILDNCPNSTLVSSHNSGSVFPVGTTVVTYTATDISGNVVTCSFTVTVTDTQVPVIAGCPANVVIPAANSSCNETATWIAPTASDNCAIQSFTSTHNPGDTFPIGTTTVTYTAVDLNGNSSTCSFTVTITDNVLPVITGCPINITVNSAPAICGAIVNWTPPTITDNCSAGLVITSTHNPGDIFPVGTTVVTYTATDGSGNSVNCSFNVTIIDSIAPVVNNCPSNITVNNTFNTCGAVVSWTPPTFTDNCNGAVNVMASHFPGTIFPIGSTVVTYTATDAAGNTSVCFFTVTVTDTQVPVFAGCPIDIVVFNEDSICGENVNWAPPVVIDNCQNVTVVASHNPGDLFPIGTTTVTYIATDAGGNSDTCSFNVTVLDKESPVISGCPGNIVINSEPGVCGANVGWIAPTATDNCGVVSLLTTNNPGSFFPVGVTTVTYSAVDAGNNVTTCVFTVTVLDVEAPVITNCPSDITVITNANSCTAVVNWIPPTVMDNCGNGNNITLVSSHANGSSFSTGTTVVTLTYTDLAGNSSVCTFNVNVIDSVPPVIVNCPSDITSCNALVTWTPPTASDNCNLVSFVSSHNPGVMFPSGNTVVTYTAIDASGNITVCSFNVFVGSPVLNIQTSNVTCYGQQNGSASVTVTSGAAPFTYDWGIGSGPVLQNLGPGFYTITVTDANGCLARDSVSITQPDSLELNIGSVSAAICGFGNGAAIITVDGGTPGYSFLWSNGATTQNLSDVSEGTYALSVTDANGCTADSLVVVIDGQFGIIPQLVTPNADGHNDTWVIPCIENYPDAVVELYNRWGNLIFKREGGYKNDWAGYSEGMLNVGNGRLPAATYFYVIKLNNDTKPLTGYIELQY